MKQITTNKRACLDLREFHLRMVGVRKLGNFCRLQLNVSPGALMDETRNSSLLTSDNILKSIFLHQLNLCIDDDEDGDNGADTFLYIPKYLNI